MNDKFHFYHFPALPPEAIIERFTTLSIHQAMEAYGYWLQKFEKRSYVFYRSQYGNHVDYANRVGNNEYSLARHDEQMEDTISILESLVSHFTQRKQVVSMRDMIANHYDYLDALFNDHFHPRIYQRQIDELWFNTTINRPDEVTPILRSMPYDKYLHTGHWREVRAAMLLIQGARCHSTRCYGNGEGYWEGWEVDMHVHHLTYKNRGNERYADLMLLCNRCHEAYHNGHTDVVRQGGAA
jgi:hypothetical protein